MSSRYNSYWIIFAFSIAVLLQFDYLFDGNHRWLSSKIVILLAAIFFLVQSRASLDSVYIILGGISLATLFLVSWAEIISWGLFGTATLNFLSVSLVIAVTNNGLKNCTPLKSNNILKSVTSISLLALIVECYMRFAYPFLDIPPTASIEVVENKSNNLTVDNFFDSGFYFFKLSSIMFYDSNYVGIYALIVFVLTLKELQISASMVVGRSKVILSFVLIVLTFSRASIISLFIIILLYFILNKKNKKYIVPFAFISLVFMTFFAYNIFNTFSSDYSFNAKIQTFISLGSSLSSVGVKDLFFGRGFEEGVFLYSYEKGAYAHAAIPLLLGTVGLIGTLLYLVIIFIMAINGGKFGYLLLMIFFVNGFSIFDPWQLFYFWALCFMWIANKRDKRGWCD